MTAIALLLAQASYAAGDSLVAEISRQITESSPWEGADVEVSDIQVPNLPNEGYDEVRVELPRNSRNIGKVSFAVEFYSRGKMLKSLWGSARVKVYKDTVVALGALKMNRKIEKEDLKLVRMELTEANEAASSIEEAAGMIARRPIAAGAPIKREYLRSETLVKRGDRVIVLIESDKVKIRTIATATGEGARGSMVSARTSSGRELSGVVTAPGELTVGF